MWELLYADDLAHRDTERCGLDVWRLEAGYLEERAAGELGKGNDDGDWGGRWSRWGGIHVGCAVAVLELTLYVERVGSGVIGGVLV